MNSVDQYTSLAPHSHFVACQCFLPRRSRIVAPGSRSPVLLLLQASDFDPRLVSSVKAISTELRRLETHRLEMQQARARLMDVPILDHSATTISVLGDWISSGATGSGYELRDYRLSAASPCIDAADNTVPGLAGITEDLDGNPRFVDGPDTPDSGNGAPPVVDMNPASSSRLPPDSWRPLAEACSTCERTPHTPCARVRRFRRE